MYRQSMLSGKGKSVCGIFSAMFAGGAVSLQEQEKDYEQKKEEFKSEIAKMLALQTKQQNVQIEELKKQMEQQRKQIENQQRTTFQAKRFGNPDGNVWDSISNKRVTISSDGLKVKSDGYSGNVWADEGFPIPRGNYRKDIFPGPVLYYFEVNLMSYTSAADWHFDIGLSDGSGKSIGHEYNSYALRNGNDWCYIDKEDHKFKWPMGAMKPEWKGLGDIVGCGLVLDSKNKLSIFFTLNGHLIGKQIPITPSKSKKFLYPAVSMNNVDLEANFGDNPEKPFKYNIQECPGLVLE